MPEKDIVNVWLTLDKLRAAVYRHGINLWNYFRDVVHVKTSLISESDFVKILCCLQQPLGISDREIEELAEYFRVQDGRVLYSQFCQAIHDAPNPNEGPEGDFEGNILGVLEERAVRLLLTKIATLVNLRKLVWRPYLQDYELISKKCGCVTMAHFARMLSFMGIKISSDEFLLLKKKFGKDSYNVDYFAFLKAINYIVKYLDKKNMLDVGGDLLQQWPGRSWVAELPALPRPEFDPCCAPTAQSVLPLLKSKHDKEELVGVVQRIRSYIFYNGLGIMSLFKELDHLDSGRVTVTQFRQLLETISRMGRQRLWISDHEMNFLICIYRDPTDPIRICYRQFLMEVDCSRKMDTTLTQHLQQQTEIQEPDKEKVVHWWETHYVPRDFFKETMESVKEKVIKKNLDLKPTFNDYDKSRTGHVRREEFRRALLSNGLLVSPEELATLEGRFTDDMGFNYFDFVKQLQPSYSTCCQDEPEEEKLSKKGGECKPPTCYTPTSRKQTNIVDILAKLKRKAYRCQIELCSKFKYFDSTNSGKVSCSDFQQVLENCGFSLSNCELQTVFKVYEDKNQPGRVAYVTFCDEVEGWKMCSDTLPVVSPMQHQLINDCLKTFLSFEERYYATMALEKLASKPGVDLMSTFIIDDPRNIGTIPRNKLPSILHRKGLMVLLSPRELECLAKAFSYEVEEEEVDYRALCRSLELLYITKYRKPC